MSLLDDLEMGGLGGMMGMMSPNMSGAYGNYNNKMQGLAGRYNPWVNLGLNNMQNFSKESQNMYSHPAAEQNKLAESFYDSPYQQHALQSVKGMMNQNSAETGMMGSQAANENLGSQLTNMQGRFQQNYVDQGLGQFNNAMRNQYQVGQSGLGALGAQNQLAQEGYLGQMQGANANAQHQSGIMGDALGLGLGTASGDLF
mgnify:CR=1 FL=1